MNAVHQLLPVFSRGDAIGGAVRVTQKLLRGMGLRSEVFADLIDPSLAGMARPADDLQAAVQPGDIVLYHLSIGSEMARLLETCGARPVLIYHNITPPEFYERTSPRVAYWLRRGLGDLARLAPRVELVIADSTFNLDQARAAGAAHGVVIPPPVDLGRLHPRPAQPTTPPQLLFVGRFAPNKRQEDLLRILAAARTLIPDCRLVLPGSDDDTRSYTNALRRYSRRLGIEDAVEFGGERASDETIGDQYQRASAFVCASEHEGFCIPLLEAMSFDVPIVAFDAGAVAETAGAAGVILRDKDPLVWAETIAHVITDVPLRTMLIDAGRRRLTDFSESSIEDKLRSAMRMLGVVTEAAA